MSFENKMLGSSKLKQRLLKRPAEIAADNPETGVIIENKSAYFVIRDCAMLASNYLPIFIYGNLPKPFITLKGVFSEKDIIDFVARAQSNKHTLQLLHLIFVDIAKKQGNATIEEIPIAAASTTLDFSEDDGVDDIYGDYDYVEQRPNTSDNIVNVQPLQVDLSDNRAVIDKLIEAFGAVRESQLPNSNDDD